MISIIVAMDQEQLIGKAGTANGMPWNIPEDLQFFRATTLHKTIVMGANTYRAIGRALPQRKTIVISRTLPEQEGIEVRRSLEEVIEQYKQSQEDLYICGGASIYQQSLALSDQLLISRIPGNHEGEVYFPDFTKYSYKRIKSTPFRTFTLETYVKGEQND